MGESVTKNAATWAEIRLICYVRQYAFFTILLVWQIDQLFYQIDAMGISSYNYFKDL